MLELYNKNFKAAAKKMLQRPMTSTFDTIKSQERNGRRKQQQMESLELKYTTAKIKIMNAEKRGKNQWP